MEWTLNLLPWDASTVKITKWKHGQQGSAVNEHSEKEAWSTRKRGQQAWLTSWNGSAFNLTIKHETKMRQAQWTQIYEWRMSERPGKNKLLDIQWQYYKKRTRIQVAFEAERTFEVERTISTDLWRKEWSHELILRLVDTWWWQNIIKMHTKTWATDTRT